MECCLGLLLGGNMKIKSIRIENFRCFKDETISFTKYTCFVGPNGAGKSTVLAALNIFFHEQSSSTTDTSKLIDEDYWNKNTTDPIRITVTFDGLNATAQSDLQDYYRQSELTVTAEAIFDEKVGFGTIHFFGQRLGKEEFRRFFDADKAGAKAPELNEIYADLRKQFPDLQSANSKDDKKEALHAFENTHSDDCVLIPSEDNFYGINGSGKLGPYIQWVYIPAVKDACDEGQEAKNTALGKLIARTVRTKINFEAQIEAIKQETLTKYSELLTRNQDSLNEISQALQRRLADWAHPDVRLELAWRSDPNKSVTVQSPVAGINTGEGDFVGDLARMGNGLQRSYLLALLQELAGSDLPDAPTMILACEEPELYQHPPQIRHLADILDQLTEGNNQVVITTHSPLFVNGEGFENTRVVRHPRAGAYVHGLTNESLCRRIQAASGEPPKPKISGMLAKIHQSLQPGIAEMFFASVPVLVEGLEDVSYITTYLHLTGLWSEFRKLGCHLVPANCKDKIITPLAILKELDLPAYVLFDADGDTKREDHRKKHEIDNLTLISLLGATCNVFPTDIVWGDNFTIWPSNLTDIVQKDFGSEYSRLTEAARVSYAQEGGLEKNNLFIAEWVTNAYEEKIVSPTLDKLCHSIIEFSLSVK